ncbi:hypothetical protein BD769DRAFT_1391044 [Suillus cothurnatus]|nr:hypothetical protein BD769DRAFT_1391044 [Suillus cothurnatus]
MAKTTKSHCPLKFYTKPTAANSEMKENLNPSQATLTTDKKRTDLVVWSKPENHHLTDALLTLIEESNKYCKAFSECLGNLYCQLASSLFINNKDSSWKGADINDLADMVKIIGLQKAYVKHHKSMTQTGQGLIDADREHKMIVGYII